jgi:UDP-N-acetylglucosamine acyltransferase
MAKIHPTAIVDATARLDDGVVVGAFCVVEEDVEIGEGTELRPHAVVRRHTRLGKGNLVDSFAVLGGDPQDLQFDPETVTYLRIGDHNVFREGVTISRATQPGEATTVGSHAYWMANAHAGHDTTVGDRTILTNGTAVGGHATLEPRVILSGQAAVHQFTWIGELAMVQGHSGASAHVPPYTTMARINYLVGLNVVGLRRAPDISDEDRRQIKEAFRLTYRAGLSAEQALAEMDAWPDMGEAAAKFREFIRRVVTAEGPFRRPLCRYRPDRRRA